MIQSKYNIIQARNTRNFGLKKENKNKRKAEWETMDENLLLRKWLKEKKAPKSAPSLVPPSFARLSGSLRI